jgi:hypothetical protein
MKSLFSMSPDPGSSFFLLKSFHQKGARAITSPEWAFMRHKEKLANRCVSETSEQGSLSIKGLA